MKGIVFTEFLEMVEKVHDYDMVDTIIEEVNPPSGGAYTAVGTYPHSEIVQLIVSLGKHTNTSVPELLHVFGRYLFDTFVENYPSFFEKPKNAFEFFDSIDEYIHVEVLKLYPDAQLPSFETKLKTDKELHLVYESERKMAMFALGLMEKALEHYKEDADIDMQYVKEDGSKVLFVISK